MMRHKWNLILCALMLFLCNTKVMAACAFYVHDGYTVNALKHFTVTLAASNISVSPGSPINTVIYQQRIYLNSSPFSISCDAVAQFLRSSDYDQIPLPETFPGSGIYKTGIDGIGIRFFAESRSFPVVSPATTCSNVKSCDYTEGWAASSYIQFIKIADVSTGGMIQSADLPTAVYSVGQNNSMVDIYKINISGSLTVNAPTCDINPVSQSMVVPMGSHKVSDFSGKGSGTAWKDASIKLQNCGFFYGNSTSPIAVYNGTNNTNIIPLTQNVADITLTPVDGIENAADGIINIADKPLKASGIGIQLSSSENVSGKINLDNHYQYSLPNDGSRTITVPLFARYIQTGNTLSAGVANGKLIYTISYR